MSAFAASCVFLIIPSNVLHRFVHQNPFPLGQFLSTRFCEGTYRCCTFGITNLWAFICVADCESFWRSPEQKGASYAYGQCSMYNRLKLILGILFAFYTAEVIPSAIGIGCIFYTIPENVSEHHTVTAFRLLEVSYCIAGPVSPIWKRFLALLSLFMLQ
ncbi:hypothetical protein OG21DRAFT_1143223 [Imleria badia]|nr:hypothetical protein OG21DRAFT_1143223 [Imleria badia]